jgi:hypothetical protein
MNALPVGKVAAMASAPIKAGERALGKAALEDVLPRGPASRNLNRPINPETLAEMQALQAELDKAGLNPPGRPIHPSVLEAMRAEQEEGRASGGRIIGAKTQSQVGLAQNSPGTTFRCGTCKYFSSGKCHNENPELKGRKVKVNWCCNLYDHPGMKVVA